MPRALLAGIAGAVAGWFASGAAALWLAGLWGMSDFEGGRGMFAFLGVGPLGGLATMLAAVWLVVRRGSGPLPTGRLLTRVAGVLAGIAALVGGGVWLRLATLDTYTDSLPPQLEFELRVPAGLAGATPAGVEVELHTDRSVAPAQLDAAWRADGDARVVAGRVALAFKTTSRLLVVSLPGQPRRLFGLRLARDPGAAAALGAWQAPDFTDAAGDTQPRRAAANDPVAVRVRVRRP